MPHAPRCPTLQAGPCAICLGNEAAPGSQRLSSRLDARCDSPDEEKGPGGPIWLEMRRRQVEQ
ncbi:hypothetical protein CKAH01_01620 [Colletotrichum kahawae]|uniref:Uncharacterized protein n=1 Tax=Colletotrichum kahawae TaxID=34407 RepID=A0AAE0D1W6_COLKA|nr:hypothetical protein CKAH01_01620 [Colletotrichum kahawae]